MVINLEKKFFQMRLETQAICERLEIEDQVVQPECFVSPPKWHLGHTTWFLEELLLNKFVPHYQFISAHYRKIFNSYYKSLPGSSEHWDQCTRGHLSRPTVKEINCYRSIIDQQMAELLAKNRQNTELRELLELAINHEEQHQELLLMDIKMILWSNPERPAYLNMPLNKVEPKPHQWKFYNEGLYEIGSSQMDTFHFDNEGPRHKYYIHPFAIRDQLVSNGDYLNFINEGGYQNPRLWKSMGFDWIKAHKIERPQYWYSPGEHSEFTLHGESELDLNAPVSHISYFEADAFARWAGARLATEQEFEISAVESPGELWCWTESQYLSYPGYRPFRGSASEYNGKFMCNQFVLRGGCFATPEGHYRKTYRNFYEPHMRWMFSGILLAKDDL